jgi:hypothetical protein
MLLHPTLFMGHYYANLVITLHFLALGFYGSMHMHNILLNIQLHTQTIFHHHDLILLDVIDAHISFINLSKTRYILEKKGIQNRRI